MADIVTKIGYAMSLRKPQQEALSYLDAISTHCDYKRDSKTAIEAVATEHCEKQRKIKVMINLISHLSAMPWQRVLERLV